MEQPNLSVQLDELERKYQEVQGKIAILQQRVEAQEYEIQERTQRVLLLEEALALSKLQLARINHLDEEFEHLKAELVEFVENRIGRPQPDTRDSSASLINQQFDNHAKALNEIRREVEKTRRFDDQIAAARAETTRLNGDIRQLQVDQAELRRQIDERVKPINLIEEQQRTMARSLAEVQAEIPDLHRKVDANLAKTQLIEQQTPQFTKYEAALDNIREEIRSHREHMDIQASERERQLKNWNDLAETTERRLTENESLMEKYAEHYQLSKRALASLQDFQEQLQREQHRFAELQRLAEERQRAELEKFYADFGQRWNKQTMELEPQFSGFQKSLDAVQQRFDEISKFAQVLEDQMNMVLQIIEEDIQARGSAINDWQKRFEELANGQV